MITELEQAPERDFFTEVTGMESELEDFVESGPYGMPNEIRTRHDGPAFADEEYVVKAFPELTTGVLESNHELLDDAGISYPSGVYWREEINEESYTVLEQRRAESALDSGFWGRITQETEKLYDAAKSTASENIALDFKPQNFGFLEDQIVYLDTGDPASVQEYFSTTEARGSMAESLLAGTQEAPLRVNCQPFRRIATRLDPGVGDRYSAL